MYMFVLSSILFILNLILFYKNTQLKNNSSLNNDFLDQKQLLGKIGEYKVSLSLNKIITTEMGEVINNLILQSKNFSTQIDHLIVGRNKKIIIIETKHYKGKINGSVKDEYWEQCIGDKIYKFKNPINQNNYHKKALEQMFKWYNISYHNIIHIVVFSNSDCELNVNSDFIIKISDLEIVANKFLKPSNGDITQIMDLLNRKNQSNNNIAIEKHNNFIKKKLQEA